MCGGLGTRVQSISTRVPKVLFDVAGRTFLDHLLERLRASGVADVVLCVGHLGELVRAHVEASRPEGLSIRLSEDGGLSLGTLGAVRRAADLLDETFLVTYGDSYLTFDYGAPLRALNASPWADGCMAVFENHDAIEGSNCAVEGDRVVRYDKSRGPDGARLDHIDYGATALRRSMLDHVPADRAIGLDTLQSRLAASGRLRALVVRERFYEIGSPQGLRDLERALTVV